MKKKIEREEIYVETQPKKAMTFFVIIDKLPNEVVHNLIFEIKKSANMFFVFSDNYKDTGLINKLKFSTLYQTNAWIYSAGCLPETLLRAFEYGLEIFKQTGYVVTSLSLLEKNSKDFNDGTVMVKLETLMAGGTSSPVLNIYTKSGSDFYSVYKKDVDPEEETKPQTTVEKVMNYLINGSSGKVEKSDIDMMYSTYTSDSSLVFLKSQNVKDIIKSEDELRKIGYFQSFVEKDHRPFLASLLKYLEIENIQGEIKDLKI